MKFLKNPLVMLWALVVGVSVLALSLPTPQAEAPTTQAEVKTISTPSPTPSPPKGKDSQYGDETKQALWIARSQASIRNRLKDPGSAQFRNVFFSSSIGKPVVCGEVNSKNALGGYVGYQRFVAAGEAIAVLETEVKDFGTLWKKACRLN